MSNKQLQYQFITGVSLLNRTDRSLLNLVNDYDDEHTYNSTQSSYYTDMEMIDIIHNKTTFTVLRLNCQSISSKFEEFKLFINDLMDHHCYVDVINLQETWLCDSSYYDDFKLPGYDLYMQPYVCTRHGGLITYFKLSLKVTVLNELYQKSDLWEGMFFSIDNLNKSVIIGNIYRPPRELLGSLRNFIEELNKVIQHNIMKSKKIILLGDFNINILKITEKPAHAHFLTCSQQIHYYRTLHILLESQELRPL